jgi:hypothetical protein
MKRLLVIIACLSTYAWASVAHDTGNASSGINGTGTTKTTASVTISGSATLVTAALSLNNSHANLTAASWSLGGGTCYIAFQGLTTVGGEQFIIACPAPTTGSGTFTATWDTSTAFQLHIDSWTGTDTIYPAVVYESNFIVANNTGGFSSKSLAPVGLTSSDATLAACDSTLGNPTSVSPNQTYLDATTGTNMEVGYALGTSGVTCNWDTSSAGYQVAAFVRIRAPHTPSAAGGCTLPCVDAKSTSFIWSQINGGAQPAFTAITAQKTNPSIVHNSLAAFCYYPSAGSITSVTDDQGDTFNLGNTTTDATNSVKASIYVAYNVAAGSTNIKANFSGSSLLSAACHVLEFDHIASTSALDGNSGATGTNGTVAAGSITPSQTGDLFLLCGFRDTTGGQGPWAGRAGSTVTQSNITWIPAISDQQDGFPGCFYGIYNSTSALNPTFAMPDSPWIAVAVALKVDGSQGSGPAAGIYVAKVQSEDLPKKCTGSDNNCYFQFSQEFPFSCSGNLIMGGISSGTTAAVGATILSIHDTNNNTYTLDPNSSLGGNFAQGFHADNAVCSGDNAIRFTFVSNANDATIKILDVRGAATAPFDKSGGCSGNQSPNVNLALSSASSGNCALSASTAHGLVFAMGAVTLNTFNNMTGTGQQGIADSYTGMPVSGPSSSDENNPVGIIYNATAATVDATFVPLFSSGCGGCGAGVWNAIEMFFEAPQNTKPPNQFPRMQN